MGQDHGELELRAYLAARLEHRLVVLPVVDAGIAEESLRNACLPVSLGRQWLEEPFDPSVVADEDLGKELAKVRSRSTMAKGQRVPFRKAVVYTWVASVLQQCRGGASRFATQTATYLLEHALNLGIFTDHQRKPRGPYDHTLATRTVSLSQ